MIAKPPGHSPLRQPSFQDRWAEAGKVIGLGAIAAFLLLVRLGRGALSDWDEAIYAEVSREMASGHHWLTPLWQHRPFFEKPPLSFWIQAQLFQWFGVSEFWARFESAIAGIAIVLLTYAIARRLTGAPAAGYFAALILLTTRQFDDMARQGTTDIPLCLCIYLAIYAYLRLREGERGWFYLMCAAIGVGAMIKGPAILVAPLAIGADWLLRNKRAIIGWRELCIGSLLALALVAPWHIWMMLKYGEAFLHIYVGYQLAERVTQVIEGSGGGPLYYAHVILYGAFPWSVVAIIAAAKWIWRREWAFSLMWLLVGITLMVYSRIPTKHPWYIAAVYPALAIEVGRLLNDAGNKWRMVRYAAVGVLAIGIAVAAFKFVTRPGDPLANHVAQLAKIARTSSRPEPLLMITTPDSQSGLDIPTAIFYSERSATLLELPADADKISDALKSHASVDAIMDRNAISYVSRQFQLQPVTRNDLLLYAEVSPKH